MVTISSPAAFRLAKAKVRLDHLERLVEQGKIFNNCADITHARMKFSIAALAIADELVEQGFANVETGEDS